MGCPAGACMVGLTGRTGLTASLSAWQSFLPDVAGDRVIPSETLLGLQKYIINYLQ